MRPIQILLLSLLLISGNATPLKRINRNPDTIKVEEKVEEETINEERNETLFAVITKFNDFYTDILPALRLTIGPDCDETNLKGRRSNLTLASSLDCLTLDPERCAASLKMQFIENVKGEFIREIKIVINKIMDIYSIISDELPENDLHQDDLHEFLDLLATDLPKLTTSIDLATLDRMYKALPDGLKPHFYAPINMQSKKLYDYLVQKHEAELPSMDELKDERYLYVSKIWYELIEDLHAVQLLRSLSKK